MQGNQLPSVNVCEPFKYAERHDLHITDQLRQHYFEKLFESKKSDEITHLKTREMSLIQM